MSRKIHIDSVPLDVREQITNDLQVKIEGSSFVYNSQPKYIYPIDVGDEYAYIPFSYGFICSGGPFPVPDRDTFSKIGCKFDGSLRCEQKLIKDECISHLNNYGSTVISAFPGA